MRPERTRTTLGRTAAILAAVAAAGAITPAAATAQEELIPEAQAARELALEQMSGEVEWRGPESSPAPQPGMRIAVISCCQAAEGAARPARAMEEVGEILDWEVDVFDGAGDPSQQNQALNAAVDAGYDGIALIFVDTPVVSDGVSRALDAGIPLITLGSLDNTPDTIPDVSHDWVHQARGIGAYMAWHSNGAVNALMLKNTDLYITENGQFKGAMEILTDPAYCPDCDMDVKDWSLANLDTQPAQIATASLRADPATDWVWCFDACMSRVVRTLIASGQGQGLQGAGYDCHGENIQLIRDGLIQAVCAADPRDWEAYAVMDNLNRMMQGGEAVEHNIPTRLFSTENVDELSEEEVAGGWQGDYDFRSKYRELWGVGG